MNIKGLAKRGFLTAAMLLLMVGTASAVHDVGVFELDKNVLDGAAAGDDWSTTLFGGGASLVSTGLITDEVPEISFTTGGSKDNGDVSGWKCTSMSVPDKDDIEHAYAAIYPGPDGPLFYFGLDRFAVNGDAQVGFWLLQDSVSCVAPASGSAFFSGHHQVGDLLILSDFTNGGVVSNIKVFEWVGSGGSDGPLDLVASGVDCVPGSAGDEVCATVNTSPVAGVPWTYTPKAGTVGTFPTSAFYEGGLNLGAFFPNGIGCFSDFLAETRSSQSLGSQLKDFALGSFDTCEITVDKTGPALSKVGDDVTYTVTITNTGITTLFLDSINDSLAGDITGDAPASCDELTVGEVCQFTYDYTVVQSDPDPLLNTVTVHYNENADASGDDVSGSDDHSVNLFQPGVQVVKDAEPNLAQVGDTITYTFTITNTSSSDAPDLIFDSISDTVLGDLSAEAGAAGCGTLATGGSCNFSVDRDIAGTDPDPLNNVVTVHYHPEGFPNDITDNDSDGVNLFTLGVTIDKTGDTLSKVGDTVNYTITVTNTSSNDAPDLDCTITDPLLGINKNVTLAPGANNVTNAQYVVQAGDPDPLPNTASVTCTADGASGSVSDSDDHSVNLFQPSVTIDKSGDTLSKVGDSVNYDFTITNTSSADAPNLVLDSINDNVIGSLAALAAGAGCSPLASGASCNFSTSRTVQAGDPDPLVNTVTVHYHPDGFPNDITASDSHSVNLFQPSVTIDKTGPPYSKAGDTAEYAITVTNTSSADSPNLDCVVTDALLGLAVAVDDLAPGANALVGGSHLVVADDPDPLLNTASVLCQVEGFPNQVSASDGHSVDLLHPSYTVTKSCLNSPVPPGASANFQIDIANTGDVDLVIDVTDAVLGINQQDVALGHGTVCTDLNLDGDPSDGCYRIEAGVIAGSEDIHNEVFVHATLPEWTLLPNEIDHSADATCEVEQGGATRTQGFWATHDNYTCHIFTTHLGSFIDLGWAQLDSCADVFGIFWANNAKTLTGQKRTPLCQARMVASQQALAAILNTGLTNGAPLPNGLTLAQIAAILGGNNRNAILALSALLDIYNNSGDSVAIVDGDGTIILHADPKAAKAAAAGATLPGALCPL
jgi:uncharacterized repeat protein (TIGR01451 family)